jgi:hypothetical protein
VTRLGKGTACCRIETVLDAGELDNELVDGSVEIRIISLGLPSLEVDGFDRDPKALTVSPTVGEGSCHACSADGVELVSIVEHLSFKRGRFGLGAKAMSRDGFDYSSNLHWGMTEQDLFGSLGGHHRMVDAGCFGLTATNVVEQNGCSNDAAISILSLCNALGNLQYAENVVEVVHGVFGVVKTPCFSNGDHRQVSDALELLPEFLVD